MLQPGSPGVRYTYPYTEYSRPSPRCTVSAALETADASSSASATLCRWDMALARAGEVDWTAMKRQAVLVVFFLALFLAACDLELGPLGAPTATAPPAPPPPTQAVSPAATATQPPPAAATLTPTAVVTVVSSFPTSTRISSSVVATAVARARAAATGTALARAGAAPAPVATDDVVYVGNTGGIGVFLRRTPQAVDRLKAYPDNTRLVIIGPDVGAEGRTWRHVRTPDGVEGYVPASYTSVQPVPTVTPAPTPQTAAATPTPIPAEPTAVPATYRDATVTNVVNGELVEVSLPGGAARVRLIGIDAPEVVGPGELFQCYGAEATSRAGELLAGQSVRLELDASQGERDAAGNLLAYVWLQDGSMYNARMIAEGFALERSGAAAYRWQGQFQAAELQARNQQLGLWHPGSCTGEVPTPTPVAPPAAPTTPPAPPLAVTPLTLSPEQRAAPVEAIRQQPDVLDAVVNQDEGRHLDLIVTVNPGTSGARGREIGESFLRLVKDIGPDDDPLPDRVGSGRHSYRVRILEPDGNLVTLGEKRWDQEHILWIGSVG